MWNVLGHNPAKEENSQTKPKQQEKKTVVENNMGQASNVWAAGKRLSHFLRYMRIKDIDKLRDNWPKAKSRMINNGKNWISLIFVAALLKLIVQESVNRIDFHNVTLLSDSAAGSILSLYSEYCHFPYHHADRPMWLLDTIKAGITLREPLLVYQTNTLQFCTFCHTLCRMRIWSEESQKESE